MLIMAHRYDYMHVLAVYSLRFHEQNPSLPTKLLAWLTTNISNTLYTNRFSISEVNVSFVFVLWTSCYEGV